MNKKQAKKTIKHPILRNALWIVLILIALAVISSLLLRFGTRHGSHLQVPDFSEMHIDDAMRLANDKGFEIIVNDSLFVPTYDGGAVLDQLPKGGAEVKPGRKVYVTINSSRQKLVKIPYVAERSLRRAKNMLESAGLEIARLEYVDDIATNYVLEQYYGNKRIVAGSDIEAEIGSGITLMVGVEEESSTADMPRLVGLTLARAKSKLWETGFNVGSVTYDPDVDRSERGSACVYFQSVGQGRTAPLGTVVDLRLSSNAAKIEKGEAESDAELKEVLRERAEMERLRDSLRAAGIDPDALQNEEHNSETQEEDEFFQ